MDKPPKQGWEDLIVNIGPSDTIRLGDAALLYELLLQAEICAHWIEHWREDFVSLKSEELEAALIKRNPYLQQHHRARAAVAYLRTKETNNRIAHYRE